jgi:hypothetical protein
MMARLATDIWMTPQWMYFPGPSATMLRALIAVTCLVW